ncbi:tyrosine-type recombinase/integrase [Streptomyces cucumeris]|uniref:tyrosine-type recombinase/integrase n=1 Tax=Streptomyces cucumeris TaxID=2962890 RepID=UPI003D74DEA5
MRAIAKTAEEADRKLTELKANHNKGIPTADKNWKLGDYLEYWLEEVVKPSRRATTYDLYESNIRLHLKPGIGHLTLKRLSVPTLQQYFNGCLAAGQSVRKVQIFREILSSALTRAMREELVLRNVAMLVELPSHQRSEIRPWTPDEVRAFLQAAEGHMWYPAFLLVALYGLRRGEVLGLRWKDIDTANSELHVHQQVFRAGGGLHQGPVKTQAGKRDLPLLGTVTRVLLPLRGSKTGEELVFTASTGKPVEPQNFSRAFQQICARHGIRRIKLHHVRHTAATLLKNLGVPDRDIQLILGHSHVSVTQQIYQHDTMDSRREALGRMEKAYIHSTTSGHADPSERGRQLTLDDGSGSRQNSRQTASVSDSRVLSVETENNPATEVSVAGLLDNFYGDLTGNRTPIARMRSKKGGVRDRPLERVTEVDSCLAVLRKRWLLGIVAVKFAVNDAQTDHVLAA